MSDLSSARIVQSEKLSDDVRVVLEDDEGDVHEFRVPYNQDSEYGLSVRYGWFEYEGNGDFSTVPNVVRDEVEEEL